MNVQDLINEGIELFNNKKFDEAIERLNQALDGIEDKKSKILINAQHWLGRCYLEQAMKAEGKDSEQLFVQAVEHFHQQLLLAKQLVDEQNSFQEQNHAQHWLGHCYLKQAMKVRGKDSEQLFVQAVEHFQQSLEFAEKLKGTNSIQEQINAQSWLGFCHLIQTIQAKGNAADELFRQAIEHFQQYLYLAKQLKGKNSIQKQNEAESILGICYFQQALKVETEVAAELEQNDKHCQQRLELSKKLLSSVQERWGRYFEWKEQKIQRDLFQTQEGDLVKAITTILAVLNIIPMELESTPLAHYTSPSVCERLFGIVIDKTNDKTDDNYPVDSSKVSPMRIGSSTYMNDPTEGEGLLELLNLQDLELENKADCPVYNAFFTCFSSRVNDLNQFRLYGKENGVEASGCCLVFNKSEDWLKDPNISASFGSFTDKLNEDFEESVEADGADSEDENLPLYQVAYIAYQDEYIAKEKCSIWLQNKNNSKFGIRLKYFGNKGWHECRIGKLEEALKQLIKTFKGKAKIDDEDRKALEYIRYLFKDFAFRDEEEFRLLKIEQIGSDKIEYCNITQSIYLPYADVRDMVDEVILGTNYEKSGNHRKAEVFQHLMRKHYPNVKVSRSSLPINANPPIKKD
ncbi:sel1 repeat family protein [Neisseria subflava]|uniref:Sel1 repeat family protein n=1 Tax=Neisseria subflava TaxID=28449 RepID=A0A9X9HU95_NEISU|nr:sel1 repeat family protein [Neisseria subflava]UTG69959.1 sel1 repeat family protein [Neisseria subflava]